MHVRIGMIRLCPLKKFSVGKVKWILIPACYEKQDRIGTMLLRSGGKHVNTRPENVQLLDVGGEKAINLMLLWLIMSTLMIRLLGNVNTGHWLWCLMLSTPRLRMLSDKYNDLLDLTPHIQSHFLAGPSHLRQFFDVKHFEKFLSQIWTKLDWLWVDQWYFNLS